MKNITLAMTLAVGSTLMAGAPATAQPADLDPVAVAAAARYALPIALDGYVAKCSTELSPGGYVISNAEPLRAKFSEGAEEAWPAAKEAMIALSAEEGDEVSAAFEMMGDELLRPLVDGLVAAMLTEEIKTEDCGTIERGLEILDPLPADNVAQLIGFFIELGAQEDEAE